ncbi:MAG: 2-iminoacetate synthase ThiH [Deltaproteobacteria bacterium]|nr:2-iminoacetate synthase ThiH [Deltaproteobacteria bacterium]
MSFLQTITALDPEQLKQRIYAVTELEVQRVLAKRTLTVDDFPALISPAAAPSLERMAALSRKITRLRFGSVMKLYAPLYVSNECVNACLYCGFNVQNRLARVTLTRDEVLREAKAIHRLGFRHLLLVSGEAQNKVTLAYLVDIVRELTRLFAGISIEIYPMDCESYRSLVAAGVTGIAIYQETYDRSLYKALHAGPKADYDNRLDAIERAGQAGMRDLGIGALMGLTDFRVDMSCVAIHAAYLMKQFWKSQISISFPRIRAAAGSFVPAFCVSDRDLAQTVFALRLVLPDADLVLSTRERPAFRDGMADVGITRMSAGSRTSPGGYSLEEDSLEQFQIADTRTPEEVSNMLAAKNLEPVWKDFDRSFLFE